MTPTDTETPKGPEAAPETRRLFRPQALEHYLRAQDPKEPLKVSPPWTWTLLASLGGLALLCLLFVVFWPVEVSGRSKGILRPVAGVRLLQAQVGGTLGTVYAHSGDAVSAGTPIARIDAPPVQSSLIEADRHLSLLQQAGSAQAADERVRHQEQLKGVLDRIAVQERLIASYEGSVAVQARRVESQKALLAAELVSRAQVDEAQDAMEAARRQKESAQQVLVQLKQEWAALQLGLNRSQWDRTQALAGAQAKRDALESTLDQTLLKSPMEGWLESFVARPGDLLIPGQPVAKLVPRNSPMMAVAFVPEKDRAFVKPGDAVALELDAYPSTEFGSLKGRITRIGSDLASPHEAREAFGEDGKLEAPVFRVEVEILNPRPSRLTSAALRSGMFLQIRYVLRRQRVASLMFEPLRKWLD